MSPLESPINSNSQQKNADQTDCGPLLDAILNEMDKAKRLLLKAQLTEQIASDDLARDADGVAFAVQNKLRQRAYEHMLATRFQAGFDEQKKAYFIEPAQPSNLVRVAMYESGLNSEDDRNSSRIYQVLPLPNLKGKEKEPVDAPVQSDVSERKTAIVSEVVVDTQWRKMRDSRNKRVNTLIGELLARGNLMVAPSLDGFTPETVAAQFDPDAPYRSAIRSAGFTLDVEKYGDDKEQLRLVAIAKDPKIEKDELINALEYYGIEAHEDSAQRLVVRPGHESRNQVNELVDILGGVTLSNEGRNFLLKGQEVKRDPQNDTLRITFNADTSERQRILMQIIRLISPGANFEATLRDEKRSLFRADNKIADLLRRNGSGDVLRGESADGRTDLIIFDFAQQPRLQMLAAGPNAYIGNGNGIGKTSR